MIKKLIYSLTPFAFLSQAFPCTTFATNQEPLLMAKSYDWHTVHGTANIMQRGVEKYGFVTSTDTKATWVSQFASLTFNQYGREFPNGGINERGLAIEIMVNAEGGYEKPDGHPVVNELQWIQYHLDRFATVQEMIDAQSEVRIAPVYRSTVHYFACDASGQCASFDFDDRGVHVHTLDSLPYRVLSNHNYQTSSKEAQNYVGFGGSEKIPETQGSLARWLIAASGLLSHLQLDTPQMWSLLERVRTKLTQWNLVYDLKKIEVQTMTFGDTPTFTRDLKLSDAPSLDCNPTLRLTRSLSDSLSSLSSSHWSTYQEVSNTELIRLSGSAGVSLPPKLQGYIAKYPDTLKCH